MSGSFPLTLPFVLSNGDQEMRQSIITEFDDYIEEHLGLSDEIPYDLRIEVDMPIGVHVVCDGFIRLKKSSTSHNALLCDKCKLRVPISIESQNFDDLISYFGSFL